MKTLITTFLLIGMALPALADEVITGKVKAFGPGDLITLYSEGDGPPLYFHLDEKATWKDKTGAPLNNKAIFPESTVTLHYEVDGDTDKIVVNKVIVMVPGKPMTNSSVTTTTTETSTATTAASVVAAPVVKTTDRDVIVESTATGLKATEVVTTKKQAVNAQGQIVDFVPGKSITVTTTETARENREPITYLIRKDVVYVTPDGKFVDVATLKPGVPVTIYYTDAEDIRGVDKVVVRETVTTTRIRE